MGRWNQRWIGLLCWASCRWSIWACSSSAEIEESKLEIIQPSQPDKQEYTYHPVEYRKWQSGNFQSWSTQDSRETRTIDGMNWYQPTVQHAQTFWGGRTNLHPTSVIGKKGFFRVATCEGRSFLLDPDEGAFLIHGIQYVRPGTSSAQQQALQRKFGSVVRWSEETGTLLSVNHFNYISYGSKRVEAFPPEPRIPLLNPSSRKMAYAENLHLLSSFMWDMSKNLGYAFEDNKYNRLVLLFEPTFTSYIDELTREKVRFYVKADDAYYEGKKYTNTEGGGWLVRTQQHRGEFYQNFCLRLLESRRCVGWVHFKYNDAVDTNKGVVSLDYEPYVSYLEQVSQLNQQVHSLVDYYDKRKNK